MGNLHLGSVSAILSERYSKMKGLFGTASANDSGWEQPECVIADTKQHKDVLLGIPRSLFDVDNEMCISPEQSQLLQQWSKLRENDKRLIQELIDSLNDKAK